MALSDDIFAAIDRAVTGPSKGSLSRYMKQNYTELAKRLEGHQNDWSALAEVFAEAGLKDRSGNPPSGLMARKIYERVRREHKAEADAQQPSTATQPNLPLQMAAPDTPSLISRRRTFAVSVPKKEI